jgi:hypothetical protein
VIDGKTHVGQQHYICQKAVYLHDTLQPDVTYTGRFPAITEHLITMAHYAGDMRDTTRGRYISPTADDSDVTYPDTRLGRKTFCFAKSRQMHDPMI